MERWKRIQALMEAKRRGMEAHERYLNQARSYAPGEELYMREMHFVMAVGPSQSPTMSEIAKRLDVTHGAVSQIAARLEKKGLIRREKDPADRRQTVVMLTEAVACSPSCPTMAVSTYCSRVASTSSTMVGMERVTKVRSRVME